MDSRRSYWGLVIFVIIIVLTSISCTMTSDTSKPKQTQVQENPPVGDKNLSDQDSSITENSVQVESAIEPAMVQISLFDYSELNRPGDGWIEYGTNLSLINQGTKTLIFRLNDKTDWMPQLGLDSIFLDTSLSEVITDQGKNYPVSAQVASSILPVGLPINYYKVGQTDTGMFAPFELSFKVPEKLKALRLVIKPGISSLNGQFQSLEFDLSQIDSNPPQPAQSSSQAAVNELVIGKRLYFQFGQSEPALRFFSSMASINIPVTVKNLDDTADQPLNINIFPYTAPGVVSPAPWEWEYLSLPDPVGPGQNANGTITIYPPLEAFSYNHEVILLAIGPEVDEQIRIQLPDTVQCKDPDEFPGFLPWVGLDESTVQNSELVIGQPISGHLDYQHRIYLHFVAKAGNRVSIKIETSVPNSIALSFDLPGSPSEHVEDDGTGQASYLIPCDGDFYLELGALESSDYNVLVEIK